MGDWRFNEQHEVQLSGKTKYRTSSFTASVNADHKVSTPVDWKNGDDCIIVPNLDDIQAKELFPNGWNALKPYLRLVSDPSKQNNK